MNPNSTGEAAHEMLQEWMKSVQDASQAFNILYKALMHKNVNLKAIAYKLKEGLLPDQWKINMYYSLLEVKCVNMPGTDHLI